MAHSRNNGTLILQNECTHCRAIEIIPVCAKALLVIIIFYVLKFLQSERTMDLLLVGLCGLARTKMVLDFLDNNLVT